MWKPTEDGIQTRKAAAHTGPSELDTSAGVH